MNTRRTFLCIALAFGLSTSAFAAESPLSQARTLLEQGGAISAANATAIAGALEEALESNHRGLQTAALRLVIAYGDSFEVTRSNVIDMVKLYRDNEDDRVRRMAVVALGASGDSWGLDFLARSVSYEDSPAVRQTIKAVIAG